MKNTISSVGKQQLILIKKSMSKKAYKDMCKRYRNTMTLGRNYGTRTMRSARDIQRNSRNKCIHDFD